MRFEHAVLPFRFLAYFFSLRLRKGAKETGGHGCKRRQGMRDSYKGVVFQVSSVPQTTQGIELSTDSLVSVAYEIYLFTLLSFL